MLEHISLIIPNLDCVKSYLDVMQLEYEDLTPTYTVGALDPLAELVTSNYMVINVRYGNKALKIHIRKDQWK